jgi:hypothetical protein
MLQKLLKLMVCISIANMQYAMLAPTKRPAPAMPQEALKAEIEALISSSPNPEDERRIIELQKDKQIPTFNFVPVTSWRIPGIWRNVTRDAAQPFNNYFSERMNSENNDAIRQKIGKEISIQFNAGPLVFDPYWEHDAPFQYLDQDALATLYAAAIAFNFKKGHEIAEQWPNWTKKVPASFVDLVERYLLTYISQSRQLVEQINRELTVARRRDQINNITANFFHQAKAHQYMPKGKLKGVQVLSYNLLPIFQQLLSTSNPSVKDIEFVKEAMKKIITPPQYQIRGQTGLEREIEKQQAQELIDALRSMPGGQKVIDALSNDPEIKNEPETQELFALEAR